MKPKKKTIEMYPRDFWFYRRFQSSFEIIESKGLVFKRNIAKGTTDPGVDCFDQ